MNVMGISGTPRTNGNSEILLRYALKPFENNGWNVKIFLLSELTIKPCNACESCRETGTCIINDDMQRIYDAFQWCNAIIISSPVYFLNVSAQLHSILDRHYAVDAEKPLEGKVGGAIAVGGGTTGGQTITLNTIYTWMLSCGIICVPGELFGVKAVAGKPGDILNQENQLKQAEILGSNILKVTTELKEITGFNNYPKYNQEVCVK
ncbi:MAG: flavodoxin family protein [Candidatus Lokiarchaeota archaeon]|nr:flavodoxin family protein [Candidatus Lokiarchaeota archaeon]